MTEESETTYEVEEVMKTLEGKLDELAQAKIMLDEKQKVFDKENAELKNYIKVLEEDVKSEVLKREKSVKTDLIYAVYAKGSERWDGSLLKGFAIAHPEILSAMKVGKPSVTFRLNKK